MTTATKKLHWTQTEEGKKKMSDIQKLAHQKIREAKKTKRKYTKRSSKKRSGISVTIMGPDARLALSELLSNAQYDKLDVQIRIEKW